MSTITDYNRLTGPDKAAIIMLAVGEEQVGQIFSRLDIDEIKEISQIMSVLGSVDSEVVERILKEYTEQMSSAGGIVGSYDTTEKLLNRFLDDERVEAIMDEIRGPAGRTVWDKLGNVNEAVLASYLKNEYPQTVAVVLSRIRPDHAARVLANLPDDFAIEVVMRMLRMEVVQKDILADVEKTLRAEFMSNLARTNRRDNHEVMAEIFNFFDRNTEGRFLNMLEGRHKDAADKVRALMFTFEDLARLEGAGVRALLRGVEQNQLAIALKGGSQKVRDLFFDNMSERAGKLLKEDMETMGPVRLRDVEEAQTGLVNTAKTLAAQGEILLAEGKDDELVF
jgi:flagellar motor switch protein FliG